MSYSPPDDPRGEGDRAAAPLTPAPTLCPFCRSDAISAAAKKITPETYWRCDGCGQVWNPGRLRPRLDFTLPRR